VRKPAGAKKVDHQNKPRAWFWFRRDMRPAGPDRAPSNVGNSEVGEANKMYLGREFFTDWFYVKARHHLPYHVSVELDALSLR
jgi:hypothetical protein